MTTAISKLQASLVSATQETTLALANINFDFSLVKVEAPPEYKELGAALTETRRAAAEHGSTHVTARRLGSLFESALPSLPHLTRAYGQRASEISKSPSVNVKNPKAYGPFSNFVGIDATSIWAAATSGPSAIAVHLLACMLARIWTAPEAVSIWQEIVTERKAELSDPASSGDTSLKNLVAAQLSISAEQLSEWDASARAWLRAADNVDITRQKQKAIMDVVNNVNIPVNTSPLVYANVGQVWKTALTAMDKVISGSAHSVRDGAVLVALSSWHLYPNVIVLGNKIREIKQSDSLVHSGGVITIGLESSSQESQGVSWSLSLAHIKYHGPPILSSQHMNASTGRLSVPEFRLAVLGCLLGVYRVDMNHATEAIHLLLQVNEHCEIAWKQGLLVKSNQKMMPPSPLFTWQNSWLQILADAASHFLGIEEKDRRTHRNLLALGMRNAAFLSDNKFPTMFNFQLTELLWYFTNEVAMIKLVRDLVARTGYSPESLIIRYKYGNGDSDFLYTTAAPFAHGPHHKYTGHTAWFVYATADLPNKSYLSEFAENIEQISVTDIEYTGNPQSTDASFIWHAPPACFAGEDADSKPFRTDQTDTLKVRWNRYSFKSRLLKKDRSKYESGKFASRGQRFTCISPVYNHQKRKLSLFRCEGWDVDFYTLQKELKSNDITELLRTCRIQPSHDIIFAHLFISSQSDLLFKSLRGFASAMLIYRNLPGTTISPAVISSQYCIGRSAWAESIDPVRATPRMALEQVKISMYLPRPLSRSSSFACISMLESGIFNFSPSDLKEVMAVSSGDSLYIAAPLLNGPLAITSGYEIRRVVGNIGRPGLALLIPPQISRARPHKPERWNVINHAAFDGKLEDCFQNTSLHLSFSGYELPMLAHHSHGNRFIEAFFIETVVSVHDSGEWVADIDIFKALEDSTGDEPNLYEVVQQKPCHSQVVGQPPPFKTISIECWDELLAPPGEAAVFKAYGNWQARLAATAVCSVLGHPVVLFNGHGCWDCAGRILRGLEDTERTYSGAVFII